MIRQRATDPRGSTITYQDSVFNNYCAVENIMANYCLLKLQAGLGIVCK